MVAPNLQAPELPTMLERNAQTESSQSQSRSQSGSAKRGRDGYASNSSRGSVPGGRRVASRDAPKNLVPKSATRRKTSKSPSQSNKPRGSRPVRATSRIGSRKSSPSPAPKKVTRSGSIRVIPLSRLNEKLKTVPKKASSSSASREDPVARRLNLESQGRLPLLPQRQ